MKYFTKDWYLRCQYTMLDSGLEVDERASAFSEDFYQELYIKAKDEFKVNTSIDYETYFNIFKENDSSISDEEIKNNYDMFIESMDFDNLLNSNIERFQNSLPKDILDNVKDIRVLALGYVTLDVYNSIKEFSLYNKKFIEDTIDEYNKLEKETFKDNDFVFRKESFHDAQINSVKEVGNDLVVLIDSTNAVTDKKSITFKNCTLISGEILEDYYWICDEIYIVDGKYEIHVLISYEDMSDFVIVCDDVVLN